jgi:hypothetical protein
VDLLKHSNVPLRPWSLDSSPLDDQRFGLVGDDGRLWSLSLVPVRVDGDGETVTVSCRWCDREPFSVQYARVGRRALARGLGEVDR